MKTAGIEVGSAEDADYADKPEAAAAASAFLGAICG
jgi:hypothetical protein